MPGGCCVVIGKWVFACKEIAALGMSSDTLLRVVVLALVALTLVMAVNVLLMRRGLAKIGGTLSQAADQLTIIMGSLSAYAAGAQEDRLMSRAEGLAFNLIAYYFGDPASGLPGVAVVQIHNSGANFVYDLMITYTPDAGEPQTSIVSHIQPLLTIEHSFPLYADQVRREQFQLVYSDGRAQRWQRIAGQPRPTRYVERAGDADEPTR